MSLDIRKISIEEISNIFYKLKSALCEVFVAIETFSLGYVKNINGLTVL